MFKYNDEWYDMNDSNMWSAIVDHYNGNLYIRGGEQSVLKGDKVRMGEAYVIDSYYDILNLATVNFHWMIEHVLKCEVRI